MLITLILISILGLILTLTEKLDYSIKKKYQIIILLIFSLLSLIVAIMQDNQQNNIENIINENKKINKKIQNIVQLNRTINLELKKLTNENKEINKNIKTLSIETENWITGGNSFCKIAILNNKKIQLEIKSIGKYPIRDVYVRITDYYYGTTNSPSKGQNNPNGDTEIVVDYVKYNVPYIIPNIDLFTYMHNNKFSLNIFIETRNNSFIQFLAGGIDKNGKLYITEDCTQKGTGHFVGNKNYLHKQCIKNKLFWINK